MNSIYFCYQYPNYGTSKLRDNIQIETLRMLWWLSFFFLRSCSGARWGWASSFWYAFLQRLLTPSSNFKSLSTVIPRSTYFVFVSMEEPSAKSVDSSSQLQRMWVLSLLAFIKLLLNDLKGFCDVVSTALITVSLFSFTVCRAVSSAKLAISSSSRK